MRPQANFNLKSRFVKLFVSYVFLLLPIFLIYLFMTQSILTTLRAETDAATQTQLNEVNGQLSMRFRSYSDTSVQLATAPELLRYKMILNEMNAYKGLEVLKDVKSYDAAIYDLFMYYDNGKIYSANGLSRVSVYFETTLGCGAGSADRALSLLEESSDGLHLLYRQSGPCYLLYHFPVRWNTGDAAASVNYIVQISTLRDALEPLLKSCDTYVVVSFASGEEIVYRGNAETGLILAGETGGQPDIEGYASRSVTSAETGLTLSVYYESGALYRDINRRQLFSYVVIALLLLVSVCISFMLSRHYNHPIRQLAAQIARRRERNGCQPGSTWSRTDELDYLKNTFDLMQDESEEMAHGLSQYKVMLRPQTALLLFHGLLREPAFIEQMLMLCDCEFHEDYYTVLIILARDTGQTAESVYEALKKHFEEDICSPVSINERKALAVLAGVPNPDYTFNNRRKIEDQLREVCPGDSAYLAFSQVYRNISMISHAYLEAVGGIENLLAAGGGKTAYFEKLSIESSRPETPEEELSRLENAVLQRDETAAMASLSRLLHQIEYGHYPFEVRRYLRYSILQRLIEAVKSNPAGSADALMSEAMRINPAVEDKFDDAVGGLVRQACFTQDKEDEIRNVIAYIHDNYGKYDLSLDEVAEYAGLSKSYLSKLFKIKTGKRYIDYLSELRMEQAKCLLTQTRLSMQEIVRKVGYYDVPSFRKKFKAMFGINASQYRKQQSGRRPQPE